MKNVKPHLKPFNMFLSYQTRLSKRPRHLSDTDTSAWRHRAFSPCASFLFEEGWASGCKRTPRRQGFRHRAHNKTNTLCLLFPTRAACMSINDLEFWRVKGTKSVPPILNLPQFRKPKNLQTQLLMTGDRVYFFIPLPR